MYVYGPMLVIRHAGGESLDAGCTLSTPGAKAAAYQTRTRTGTPKNTPWACSPPDPNPVLKTFYASFS